jgi:RimJ/RimL family protein N-acetyltransferase
MIELERAASGDWERVRALRLQALADSPDAFASTLAQEEGLEPDAWRERLVTAATFLAHVEGEAVGMVTAAPFRGRPEAAGLFGRWVAPDWRGTGAADRLVETVIDWARTEGFRRVVLEVADENAAAIALYRRLGFERTGATATLPAPRTHITEHERTLVL